MKYLRSKIVLQIIGGIISTVIGIELAKATIFDNFKVAIIWGIIALVTIIIGIFDFIFKKHYSKMPGMALAILTLGFIVSLPIRKHHWNEKRNKCEIAIVQLDSIKTHIGNYPESLADLKLNVDFSEINYTTDSSRQVFNISYSVDGWHREWYDSENRKWSGGD
ncbi:MAG: hypothetical protein MI866_01955 [Bacteroidales bacterium]|nr:hypothetical protein [Bacteroidales bacterium]